MEGDVCGLCKRPAMPKWSGSENGRACQNCGHVEDRYPTEKGDSNHAQNQPRA